MEATLTDRFPFAHRNFTEVSIDFTERSLADWSRFPCHALSLFFLTYDTKSMCTNPQNEVH